jgi:hypothetical protein
MNMPADSQRPEHPKPVTPLSQSRYGDMACETLYVHKHVHCATIGDSEPAARGIEIHQVLAAYINHLVRTKRATDLEVFDALMRGAGTEPQEVLERFRDNHSFDPEKILATELHIALDEDFLPIEHPGDDGQIAVYEGTLDLVMLHSLTEAEIDDWKSYYQIIDADTFQSKFYPLLPATGALSCLLPQLELGRPCGQHLVGARAEKNPSFDRWNLRMHWQCRKFVLSIEMGQSKFRAQT